MVPREARKALLVLIIGVVRSSCLVIAHYGVNQIFPSRVLLNSGSRSLSYFAYWTLVNIPVGTIYQTQHVIRAATRLLDFELVWNQFRCSLPG